MKPLLSIVIPTKNRYDYLKVLVPKLMSWDSNEFEVVVQDNSDNNAQGLELEKKFANDTRFKYFYNKHHLDIEQNSAAAIDNSNGEYVCYLGDDDGIIYHAIDVVRWMKNNDADSLNCNHGSFCWGDFRTKNRSKKASLAGMLLFKKSTGNFEVLDTQKLLIELLENGALVMNRITKVYHGIIKRDLLNTVKTKTGSYFPGPVPDMTNAVSLSLYSKKHVFLDYPLIIAGAAGNSMAGRGGQGNSHGEIKDQAFLPKNSAEEWSEELPKYWCPQTIWPEGALQALKRNGRPDLIKYLNFTKVFAEMMLWVPSKKEFVLDFIKERYSPSESQAIINKIPYFQKMYKMGRLKYDVKVLAIVTNTYKFLGLTKVSGDTIEVVLTQLENLTNQRLKSDDCDLAKTRS